MMRMTRLLLLLVLSTALLVACGGDDPESTPTPVPPTEAPTATPEPIEEATEEATEPIADHPCFNLSDEDCAIIVAAGENADAMTAFDYAFVIDLTVSGLEPFTLLSSAIPASLTFNAEGGGAFTLDAEDMPLNASVAMAVQATQNDEAALDTSLPLAVTGGNLYLSLENDAGDVDTVAVPFDSETIDALQLPLNLGDLISVDDLLAANPANFGELIVCDDLGALLNPSGTSVAPFADFQRLDDADLMGQTMQVFQFTLDLRDLLNSPEFSRALASAGGAGADDPTIGLALQLLPIILQEVESTAIITQYVGEGDGLIHKLTVELDFMLDASAILTFNPSGGADADPIMIDLLFDLELSEIDGGQTIDPLPDARTFTADELQALLDTAVADVEAVIEEELAQPEATEDASGE